MLKPERIKEIENICKFMLEEPACRSDYKVGCALEDLLIERNHILLPAMKEMAEDSLDYNSYGGSGLTVEQVLEKYCQKQWEEFG